MDGHLYYAKDEKGRLAAGIPRVDTHEYGRENGLAIAAYATMYEVTKDPAVLASRLHFQLAVEHHVQAGAFIPFPADHLPPGMGFLDEQLDERLALRGLEAAEEREAREQLHAPNRRGPRHAIRDTRFTWRGPPSCERPLIPPVRPIGENPRQQSGPGDTRALLLAFAQGR